MNEANVVVIGAGAAGLMCAITAASRGKSVLVLDKSTKAAEKVRISGGGKCNFTNLDVTAENYISNNKHFCKSALAGFNQWDFIDWVVQAGIDYHEREHGQLFCDKSANEIIKMLLDKCDGYGVQLELDVKVKSIEKKDDFKLETNIGELACESLVIATGALSIPKMGATGFGFKVAKQFGLNTIQTRPGLVPFTFTGKNKDDFKALAGIALPVVVSLVERKAPSFKEAMLFTHRGLSGPVILQISSYWLPGDSISINLIPDLDLKAFMDKKKKEHPQALLATVLSHAFPKRLVSLLVDEFPMQQKVASLSDKDVQHLEDFLQAWVIKPSSTEGYRTAEVTVGGVDTADLDSKTMQAKKVEGLYFIGEVVDVTGHLGGFNFQWAWSSGFAAGSAVA
ncbi:BaiN/RdsA family NAD(P)/FAD-dependent oxidoreductase [Ghiorsea bivora]|uniref:NAD(P)/FAD-dependent oxidoreductase n=1 Tax=Ghiorsea bivora TaxID=1485545 RepID=UPI00057004A2|nr:NAD(P)/FAD-dependent oxidoreductase [Ghiorsea bivora]